jgi:hypothetical protein
MTRTFLLLVTYRLTARTLQRRCWHITSASCMLVVLTLLFPALARAQEPARAALAQEPASATLAQEPASAALAQESANAALAQESANAALAQEPANAALAQEPANAARAQEPASAAAQSAHDPAKLSVRLVGTFAVERFAAATTFDAIFGQPTGLLVGGGARVDRGNLFVEVCASRFKRSGQRGFATDGDGYGLDIPLTVTISPIEFAVGRTFRRLTPSIGLHAGGGIGIYGYKETSPSAEAGEEVDLRHAGWFVVGGAEFRIHRLLALGADLRYTNVPGILGKGGLSQAVDEPNLGGIAARFTVIVGR